MSRNRQTRGISRRGLLRLTAAGGVVGGVAAGPLAALVAQPAAAEPAGPGLVLPPATDEVTPFRLRVPEHALRDLRARIAATRWPETETDPHPGCPAGARAAARAALAEHL